MPTSPLRLLNFSPFTSSPCKNSKALLGNHLHLPPRRSAQYLAGFDCLVASVMAFSVRPFWGRDALDWYLSERTLVRKQ
jgi:hypothetical protein